MTNGVFELRYSLPILLLHEPSFSLHEFDFCSEYWCSKRNINRDFST